jgi:hypothetical protein
MTGGAAGGSDISLVLEAPSQVTFVWDQVTHIPTATAN